ncbi:MAG: hypothetical protein ACXWKG_18505, partial [Limisphaerales bacterium]
MRQGIQAFRIVTMVCALFCAGREAAGQFYSGPVGYVQVVVSPGYNFCCNPLDYGTNTVSALFPTAPDSCAVYLWDVDAQRFSLPSVYHNGWSSNYTLPLGKGFVVYTPTSFTNTFVGAVLEGQLSVPIAGNNRLSLIASMVPQSASLNVLGLPGSDGDSVYMPVRPTQSLSDAYSYFAGYGWFDPSGVADTNGPVVPVAGCFFIQHPGPDTHWVRTFYVNNGVQSGGTTATIQNIRLLGKTATLSVSVPSGASYSIQTSPDRISWT